MFEKLKEKAKVIGTKQVILAILPVVTLVALMVVLYIIFGRRLLIVVDEPEVFKMWIRQYGAWDEAIFTGIRAAQTVFKFIPAEPLELAAGYVFGTWMGLLWCMVGTELGSAIIILLTKKFGMKFVSIFTDPENLKSFGFLKNTNRFRLLLFVIYFIPGAPKDLLTYFVAFTPLSISEYLLITSIARIPSIITSTLCGAYFGEKNYLAGAVVYGITLLISGIGVFIYRAIQKRHPGAQKQEAAE